MRTRNLALGRLLKYVDMSKSDKNRCCKMFFALFTYMKRVILVETAKCISKRNMFRK
jgi:hypothetical protein